MAEIVGISGIVYDFVCHVANMPHIGETVLANGFKTNLGGKVANSLVQASLLGGVTTSLIGKIGQDQFGKEQIDNLKSYGIQTDNVRTSPSHPTSTAFISIDRAGANQIVLASGADQALTVSDILEMSESIAKAKVLLCCYEVSTEVCAEAFSIARRHGVATILVPAPIPSDFGVDALPEVDFLCANEIEAGQIVGMKVDSIETAIIAVQELHRLTKIKFPIITLGDKGAVLGTKMGEVRHVPAPHISPVDTTGAGDSFVGSLAHQLVTCQGKDVADMVLMAVQVASQSTLKHGTRTSYVSKL